MIAHTRNVQRSLVAALSILLFAGAAIPAMAERMTADKVHDKESLKAFVLDTKRYVENLLDYNDVIALRETLRQQPRWASGDTYLLFLLLDGSISFHAGDRSSQGRDILDIRDDRGVAVARELMKVGEAGGGFVDYVDGVPKTAYSIKAKTGVGNIEFYMVGGYTQDLSTAPLAGKDIPPPPVTAAEVVDKESLVAFVEAAADAYRGAYETEKHGGLMAIRNAFRKKGGAWRSENVYLWLVGSKGYTIFHATEQYREGKPTDMERVDSNGLPFPKLLIGGALREGRKFVRYYYDDPEIEGDEDTGSPKFGYAVSFNAQGSDQKVVVGSGIYLKDAE